jgi:hypothetical protein
MAEIHEYRTKRTIRAERILIGGRMFTTNGASYVVAGDYLVYRDGLTSVIPKAVFESEYELIDGSEIEKLAFNPVGKTVDVVIKFLRENPDQISRVKGIEEKGTARKGIMEYEKP